ncbi:hypothetical protein KC953_00840, partial [Candidatus Saccharibacteria bacterium]|nr:hypothetical protein [Candidatus Saccharibacteria bacterium]
MLSIEVISLIFIIVTNLVVFWMIASQSWRVKVIRYFILAVMGVVLWAMGTLLLVAGTTQSLVDVGRSIFLIAPMYVILFLALFAAVFPRTSGRTLTPINFVFLIITLVFSLVIAFEPTQLITSVVLNPGYNDIVVDGFWYSMYILYFNLAFLV